MNNNDLILEKLEAIKKTLNEYREQGDPLPDWENTVDELISMRKNITHESREEYLAQLDQPLTLSF